MEIDFANIEPEAFFPSFNSDQWSAVQETLKGYARMLAGIRFSMDAPQPHRGHAGLRVASTGLTTTPIMAPNGIVFDITLDLVRHCIHVSTSKAGVWSIPFFQQSTKELYWQLRNILSGIGIDVQSIENSFTLNDGLYDKESATQFHTALTQVDFALKRFRGELRTQMSLVSFWPDPFQLSMNTYTGRAVPDTDPADELLSDERMSFGFSPGDAHYPDPYFFVSVYPWNIRLTEVTFDERAFWVPGLPGYSALPYNDLRGRTNSFESLIEFYRSGYDGFAAFLEHSGSATPES